MMKSMNNMKNTSSKDASNSTIAFKRGMSTMMDNMSKIGYTGNTDIDFARQMQAHHKGAIAMAKTEINYGNNPGMMKLADDIIKYQTEQVEEMQRFIDKNRYNASWKGLK